MWIINQLIYSFCLFISILSNISLVHYHQSDKKLFFKEYQRTFGKIYLTEDEELFRFTIFDENVNKMISFNQGDKGYSVGLTQFSDMKINELKDKYLVDMTMHRTNDNRHLKILQDKDFLYLSHTYKKIDWRENNIFLPARNQGDCGGCWAFASVGTIEGIRYIKFGIKKYLSPQQLIDCDIKEKGCKGGWPSIAYRYIADNGLASEEDYSYLGKDDKCKDEIVKTHQESLIERRIVSCEEEECMANDYQYNMLLNGPVAVAIDAYNTNFFNYKSGIYNETCGEPNHAIILVGFGISDTGEQYWIIRNSWDVTWGIDGYGYVKFDLSNYLSCNINRYGYQPTVIK